MSSPTASPTNSPTTSPTTGSVESPGRTVAVTGAAHGIGLALAEELVRRGTRVLLGDLDPAEVAAVATRLGPLALAGALDVTDQASYETWLALADVDVLVNNAGVMRVGRDDEETAAAGRRMMDVNFWGVVRGTRLVLPRMRQRGRGHVVTIVSVAAYISPAGEATYAATKHAVRGWLTGVREELRGTGVHLSMILPAVVETELAAGTASGGVARLTPAQVAVAVADVVERPRFEVFLPARTGLLTRLFAVLPQRGRDALTARLVPDQAAATGRATALDQAARAAYEARHHLD